MKLDNNGDFVLKVVDNGVILQRIFWNETSEHGEKIYGEEVNIFPIEEYYDEEYKGELETLIDVFYEIANFIAPTSKYSKYRLSMQVVKNTDYD